MQYVGIDLGKTFHQVAVVGMDRELRLQPFTISRGRQGLTELFKRLQFLRCDACDLICTVEATGNYWHELVWGLRERGCTVYLAHPKKAHDLRRFYDLHTKTDITDAEALALMPLVDDKLNPVWIPSEAQQTLLRLCRLRWKERCRIADVKRRVSYLIDTVMPGLGRGSRVGTWRTASLKRGPFCPGSPLKRLALKQRLRCSGIVVLTSLSMEG